MDRTPEHNAKIGAALRARGVGSSPTKVCPRCGQEFPREYFGQRSGGHTKTYCPPCHKADGAERAARYRAAHPERGEVEKKHNRKATLKRYYGITVEEYDALLVAQGGLCAICRGPQTHGRENLDVDHCHATGRIRGLLCSHCNRGIGLLGDDPERMRAAAAYLECETDHGLGSQVGRLVTCQPEHRSQA